MTSFTIPQTTVPAGPIVIGPLSIGSTISQYILTLQQVNWLGVGDLAFTYICDVSLDGGNTWISPPPSSGDVFDSPIPSRRGQPANQFIIACSIPGVGNPNRIIRLSANFAKSLTISGSLMGV